MIWPKGDDTIVVNLTDKRLANEMPADLFFEIGDRRQIEFTIEDRHNKRLIELQDVIARRLQEFVNKM